MNVLQPFQKKLVAALESGKYDTLALSLPRGNGKSWLAAHILGRCLTPGDVLFNEGMEYILCAASLEQARHVFRFMRQDLGEADGYRYQDSSQRLTCVHEATNTRLRVQSSNGKTAMGIVGCPLLVADEPGAWETRGGELMNDAIQTAQGKPGSPLKVLYIGTLAPALEGWWHDLIDAGTTESTYVMAIHGERAKWANWRHVLKCNPLARPSVDGGEKMQKTLKEELEAARKDTRLKARFLSYRMNVPTADESEMLLTVDDWELATQREVPPRSGLPIVGVDLGGGRAWSAAVAVWENGRIEAQACAPGIPSLAQQEERDNVASGLYQKLVDAGVLEVAHGLRVQPPSDLWEAIVDRWGVPGRIVCDRFRLAELADAAKNQTAVEPRVTRWSEAGADIRALRKHMRDGPFAIPESSRLLLAASLSVAVVKNDDQGNTRLIKKATDNKARDDVAAALVLAAGAYDREMMMLNRDEPAQEEEVWIAR